MIVEALRHLLIRCPPELKRLGVLYDLIALEARAKRLSTAWASHRTAAAAALADLALAAPQKDTCIVAGSGLLLEVPLEALAGAFRRVVLVDLFHMPAVRRRAARLSNVALLAHDVTGVLAALGGDDLPAPAASLAGAAEADVVISANLTSQLALTPLAVQQATGRFTPDALAQWEKALIADHLALLAGLPGRVVLLTDVERQTRERGGGAVVDAEDLLRGVPLPGLDGRREWWWDIAPAPEEHRRRDVRHRVVAGVVRPVTPARPDAP